MTATFSNRVTELLGVDIPIVQAPMGWIARAQLASAVSNAGAMGIIETSSGELDIIRDEIRKMRDLTDKPFGVNIAQAFVRDPVHRRVRRRSGREVRDHISRQPDEVHGAAQGGGSHRLPRRAGPEGRAEGGGRGGRRPHRRGRRRGWLQEPSPGVDDGAPAARRLEGRRPGDRGRRVRRRPHDGRRPRAGCGGSAARHAHGVVRREPDPRQLEAGRPRRAGDRHGLPQPAHEPRRCAPCAPSGPTRSSSTPRPTPWRCSATPWTSTSGATWRPPSRSPARSPVASTRSSPSPRSSTSAPTDCLATLGRPRRPLPGLNHARHGRSSGTCRSRSSACREVTRADAARLDVWRGDAAMLGEFNDFGVVPTETLVSRHRRRPSVRHGGR